MKHLYLYAALGLFVIHGCSQAENYRDLSLQLTDQNGETVSFPEDFEGNPVVLGFIYTNCPDICSMITANLYKVWQETDQREDIHFVLVTFDPVRDQPEVLKSYAEAFNMDREPFTFLTGTEKEIETMMERMGVRINVSYTEQTEEGEEIYFLNHTDKILLIDSYTRLVMDYAGSVTPSRILVEDLERL